MASKSSAKRFDQPLHEPRRNSDFSSPDELISFAQGYFASDFPNPDGLNCPIKGWLPGFVRSGKIADSRLRSHLFGCSECLGEYQNALAAYRTETKPVGAVAHLDSWWTQVFAAPALKPVPVFACALSLILLVFVGLVFVGSYVSRGNRNAALEDLPAADGTSPSPLKPVERITRGESLRQTNREEASKSRSSKRPAIPARPVERITRRRSLRQTNQQEVAKSSSSKRSAIKDQWAAGRIDFRDYAMVRGGGSEITGSNGAGGSLDTLALLAPGVFNLRRQRTHLHLVRTHLHLVLRLPDGSAKGLYVVSVSRTSGESLVSRRARSKDGKTLLTTLTTKGFYLPGMPFQRYVLRISRKDEPLVEAPILVSDKGVITAEKVTPDKSRGVVRPVKKP